MGKIRIRTGRGTGTIEVDDIINADSDFSQWRDRDRMWMNRKL